MPALRLLVKLVLYYAALLGAFALVTHLVPGWREYLPVGRVQSLVAQAGDAVASGKVGLKLAHAETLTGSMVWLVSAVLAAVLTAFPVSWVYMEVRNPEDYDQSLVDTIVVLPLVVTSIVVVVQNSLALSFSLAGIAGAARFRNSMKSSGDLLFILLAIAIGLSCGIGAMELAVVTSIGFNLCFALLWLTQYGERQGRKQYMSDCDEDEVVVATTVVATATETVKVHKAVKDDDD